MKIRNPYDIYKEFPYTDLKMGDIFRFKYHVEEDVLMKINLGHIYLSAERRHDGRHAVGAVFREDPGDNVSVIYYPNAYLVIGEPWRDLTNDEEKQILGIHH